MTDRSEDDRGLTEVLVVDDSALVRQLMTVVLSEKEGFRVRTAADPLIAMRKIETRRPDAIVLDLQMPKMDGLTFLRRVMTDDPIPVVICSSIATEGSEMSMRALQLGAIDVILKPSGAGELFQCWKETLIDRLVAAAHAKIVRPAFTRRRVDNPQPIGRLQPVDAAVVIGASTGGTEAIVDVLSAMPENAPATVIVQHMPAPFTAAFAKRLDATCAMRVREAADGDVVEQGTALVAPGDRHVILRRHARSVIVELDRGAPVNRHRPSVDVLFESAAHVLGSSAIGVLLTGMGHDGAKGLLDLRNAGAVTIAQDEATSVVFGMPRAAIEAGAAVHVLPLQQIGETVIAASVRSRPLTMRVS